MRKMIAAVTLGAMVMGAGMTLHPVAAHAQMAGGWWVVMPVWGGPKVPAGAPYYMWIRPYPTRPICERAAIEIWTTLQAAGPSDPSAPGLPFCQEVH